MKAPIAKAWTFLKQVRLMVCFGLSLTAVLVTAADLPEQTHDYRRGLAQFAQFGLPDITTAAYVKIERCWSPHIDAPLPYDYESSGNAWMLTEARGTNGQPISGTFVINGGEIITLDWDNGQNRRATQNDPYATASSSAQVPAGRWKKGHVERDVKTALRFLKSLDSEKYPEIKFDAGVRGRLFLLAFYMHQRGDLTNSTVLLNALFKRVEPTQKLLGDAMNVVADAQYENVYRRFRENYDWAAYRNSIKELLAKYPRGWRKAPGIQFLLGRIEERLALHASSPSAENKLSEADLKLAGRMMGIRVIRKAQDGYNAQKALWLVPSAWRGTSHLNGDVELEILVRGMAGIPFLLAMAHDGVLTEADAVAVCGNNGFDPGMMVGAGAQDDETKVAFTVFKTLHRPATRGEVAQQWLTAMVPEAFTGGQWNRKKGEELLDAIKDFYDGHFEKSEEELATLCLPGQYGNYNKLAADFLLKRATSKRVAALEAYLLGKGCVKQATEVEWYFEDGLLGNKIDLLVKYVAIRGVEVRPMVDEVVAQLRKTADEYTKPRNQSFGSAEQEKKFIENKKWQLRQVAEGLAKIIYDKPIKEWLDSDVYKPGAEGGYARELLLAKLDALPFSEAFGLLIQQAAMMPETNHRLALAGLVRQLAGTHPVMGIKPTDYANQWRLLIADGQGSGAKTNNLVSDQFLILNERLFAASKNKEGDDGFSSDAQLDEGKEAAQIIADYSGRGREFLRERVRARLEGTPEIKLPKYPLEEPFSAEAYERMRNRLVADGKLNKAAEVIGEFSIFERAALPELLRKDPVLNAKLAAIANVVTKVTMDGVDDVAQKKFMTWRGVASAPALLRDLKDYCESQARAGHAATCLFARKADFGGCEVSIQSKADPSEISVATKNGKSVTSQITGLTGMVCGRDLYGAAVWRTGPVPGTQKWGALVTSEPDILKDFEVAINELCGSKMAASEEAFAVYQTKGDSP